MKLQNGFEVTGNISNSVVNISDEWTKILVVETSLEVEQARELFKDNNTIIETDTITETTHMTKGLIDVKTQDDKSYVWLYFDYSYIKNIDVETLKKENLTLKDQLATLENYILEKVQSEIN